MLLWMRRYVRAFDRGLLCCNGGSMAADEALGVDAAAVAAQHISHAGSRRATSRQTGQDTSDPLCTCLCCLCLVQVQLRPPAAPLAARVAIVTRRDSRHYVVG